MLQKDALYEGKLKAGPVKGFLSQVGPICATFTQARAFLQVKNEEKRKGLSLTKSFNQQAS